MERLMAHFSTFPCDVAFANVPRLGRPGSRWAPRSFLNLHDHFSFQFEAQQGIMDIHDLKATFSACIVESGAQSTGEYWHTACQAWPDLEDHEPSDLGRSRVSNGCNQVLELVILRKMVKFGQAEKWVGAKIVSRSHRPIRPACQYAYEACMHCTKSGLA